MASVLDAQMASMLISEMPRGYPASVLGANMNGKFACWYCKLVLKNPVQCFCGHRVCKDCMKYILRISNGAPVICESCKEEDSVTEESHLKEEETFADNAIRREMSNLEVQCSYHGCIWKGTFKEYEVHHEACDFFPVNCDVCGTTVPRQELSAHKDSVHASSGTRICPYGCNQEVDMATVNSHLSERLSTHFDVILRRCVELEKSLRPAVDQNSENRIANNDSRIKSIEERLQQLQQLLNAGSRSEAGAVGGAAAVAATAAVEGDSWDNKFDVVEGVLTVLSREVEKLTGQNDAFERQRADERELLDSLERKVRTLERTLTVKDGTIAELELRLTNLENTSYDGTLLWRISDFQNRRQDAINGRSTSIYSPPFYTSRTGYKMCARLYLNGDGMGKGTHVSLFFVVMRGTYDALLKWPFRQKVTLMFMDQNGREHVVDAFRPDPTSSSFKRPTTDMNIASGCPLLMPLTSLDSNVHAYVKDNTAFIKIIVNCEDLQ